MTRFALMSGETLGIRIVCFQLLGVKDVRFRALQNGVWRLRLLLRGGFEVLKHSRSI